MGRGNPVLSARIVAALSRLTSRASLNCLFLTRMPNRSLRLRRRVERAAQRLVHAPLGFLVAVLFV